MHIYQYVLLKRGRNELPRCSFLRNIYFKFICLIESIYLTNLNIQMMRAHTDEDVVDIILGLFMKNKFLTNNFCLLCEDISTSAKEDQ